MIEFVLPALRQGLMRGIESIGILCLTESPANLLMWAHYADSHRGFVVEVDPSSPFFDRRLAPDDELRHLRQMTYSTKRPSIVIADTEDFSSFLVKGDDWRYETEWRMMDAVANASRVIGSGSDAIHLFAFPGTAIRSVIFGNRMTNAAKEAIREAVGANPEYGHVTFRQAMIDEEHYRVLVTS